MSFASTSSTSFQNNFTQIIKRSFYSYVHDCIHILRMLLNFEQAYSHIYCSFADEYETKFRVPIQVSGDQSINNTLVSTPVSTIQLPKLAGHLFMSALRR